MTITVDMTTASAMIKVTDVFVTMSTILIIDITAANMITVTFMFKKNGPAYDKHNCIKQT